MIDKTIYPNYYAYSLRFDVNLPELKRKAAPGTLDPWLANTGSDSALARKFFLETLEKYEIKHYLGTYEISKITKKPHMQAIVWFPQKQTRNFLCKVRNYIQRHMKGEPNDGGRAFAPVSKDVKSLAAYCCKTQNKAHEENSLTPEQYAKIPQWKSHETISKDKKVILEAALNDLGSNHDFLDWTPKFSKIYAEIYGTPCLHRASYFRHAYKHKIINNNELCELLGVNDSMRRYQQYCEHQKHNSY